MKLTPELEKAIAEAKASFAAGLKDRTIKVEWDDPPAKKSAAPKE
jgi:hypothetical protein